VGQPGSSADRAITFAQTLARERQGLAREPTEPARALCISGGGIRSATFALGAIQELARRGLLGQFDYLSTVSGGGYIGSWLSAWIHRAGGLAGVLKRLDDPASRAAREGTDEDAFDPVEHLREYNSYLTPRVGFASADSWTVVAIIVRNLLLNWLLLVPLLMGVLMVPRVLVSLLQIAPPDTGDPFPGFDTLEAVVVGTGIALYAVATFNGFGALPSLGGRDITQAGFVRRCLVPLLLSGFLLVVGSWWVWDDLGRKPTLAMLVVAGLAVTVLSWVALLVAYDLFRDPRRFLRQLFGPLTPASAVFGVVSGATTYVLTHVLFEASRDESDPSFYAALAPALVLGGLLLGQMLAVGFTSRTLAEPDREWVARSTAYTLIAVLGWLLLSSVVLVIPHFAFGWRPSTHAVLAAIGALAGWLTSSAPKPTGPSAPPPGLLTTVGPILRKAALPVFLLLLMLALTMLTNWILAATGAVDARFWDHHTLVEHTSLRASLGLLLALAAATLLMGRYVNINTFSLHAMYKDRLIRAYLAASNEDRHASSFTGLDPADDLPMSSLRGQKPVPVLNLTLNLVGGEKLAWQQRKAESFTVTPYDSGSRLLGYRDSAAYGGPHGISLGTAMTISGAAASPNMGYASSPLVGFTMMLFNARLGWWLGNPGRAGRKSWRMAGPRYAVAPVVKEMLGLTDDTSPYVYLSDGGHFENLALYEMVLRRCRTIVVLDGDCDPSYAYADLGNALRKVRIDFGIPIEFEPGQMALLEARKRRAAVARIRYSAVEPGAEDGWLLFLKPMLLGNEPPDVRSYAAAFPAFPHQTTANQWFNEAQTESYRMLGEHTVADVCGGFADGSLEELVESVGARAVTA
jgi:Patatin-like phospholipase